MLLNLASHLPITYRILPFVRMEFCRCKGTIQFAISNFTPTFSICLSLFFFPWQPVEFLLNAICLPYRVSFIKCWIHWGGISGHQVGKLFLKRRPVQWMSKRVGEGQWSSPVCLIICWCKDNLILAVRATGRFHFIL